ncbi:GNAT family N-acetyltransferase [Oerskovia turbata]|uniref:GNAT family N-acetyltransferase n=2 Tax=Oerskovia TaxID=162491 RepID=A0A4Q1KMR5_9CELL|nr:MULTISPECIES: GNAT family N-acetyltransferase [Oerskovia]TGJ94982.1 GNAT family N-acetyltransferase [Actinotalea fermentans ATCC 43279 = JCM 9966 = DSM 3133]KRC37704.1 GCN5 family acetyltransferase [Oerskovia sp. Root22]KRD41050.1 GCN5 family acetyltransferase [Oerskovia sp. Root918]KZM36521.1 acetyltransferase (GNAT) family protein [Oerskovia enterophila]OCI29882.1 acetyltransferase (GNAT) family protein [Oerskovia enterophila]
MTDTPMTMDLVTDEHAGELLTLRRAAFVTEAQLYGDPNIPPLTQTLAELKTDLATPGVITLGAWQGPRLVGSVRVEIEGGKATLGRLAVAPDLQGRGIGTQMLFAVLPHLPEETTEIWVFTGKDSKQNLELYTRHGYEEQYDKAAGDLTYTYLRRILGEAEARNASDAVGQD